MELIRFNAPHGAEIRNLDLSQPMSEETVESVRSAWHENPVLLFRGQNLDDQLMALAQAGELELPPSRLLKYSHGSGQKDDVPPEINVISNMSKTAKKSDSSVRKKRNGTRIQASSKASGGSFLAKELRRKARREHPS